MLALDAHRYQIALGFSNQSFIIKSRYLRSNNPADWKSRVLFVSGFFTKILKKWHIIRNNWKPLIMGIVVKELMNGNSQR